MSFPEIAHLPAWCLSQYVLIDCNHILSQHAFCRASRARLSRSPHKRQSSSLFPSAHGCPCVLSITLNMCGYKHRMHPRSDLISALCCLGTYLFLQIKVKFHVLLKEQVI